MEVGLKNKLITIFVICVAIALIGCASTGSSSSGAGVTSSVINAKYQNKGFNQAAMTTWGALNCHDPKLFQDDDGTYYVYSTDASIGNMHQRGLQVRTSKDLITWKCLPQSAIRNNWDKDMLDWVGQTNGNATSWAPTVIKQNGKYYMFHGIITDAVIDGDEGRPAAWIGLAISDKPEGPFIPAHKYDSTTYKQSALVRYVWSTRPTDTKTPGMNYRACKNNGGYSWFEGFGAIDPEFVYDITTGQMMTDEFGDYYMTYGSWKAGIALITVDNETFKPTYKGKVLDRPLDETEGASGIKLAGGYGAPWEGAQLIYNSETGYYYLFCSTGNLDNDYSVRVGRSKNVEGPFVDAQNQRMVDAYDASCRTTGHKILGAFVLGDGLGWRSLGGMSLLKITDTDTLTGKNKMVLCSHARTNFQPSFYFYVQTRQLYFTKDGWPVLNPNEYSGENLKQFTVADLAGTYDVVMTVRSIEKGDVPAFGGILNSNINKADGMETESVEVTFNPDGTISGAYTGKWTLATDGYNAEFSLEKDGKYLGKFNGLFTPAIDWAKKEGNRNVITFSAVCGELNQPKTGEHLFGNKK